MNVERLNQLADVISEQPHTSLEADSGFNMSAFIHHCGTPSCIGGWALQLFNPRSLYEDYYGGFLSSAKEALDLTQSQAEELFAPLDVSWSGITPLQAAATIRHLAATGEVNWGPK